MIFLDHRQMLLNSATTNLMVFKPPAMKLDVPSTVEIFSGLIIRQVASTKYLGLVLSENLSWTSHIESQQKASTRQRHHVEAQRSPAI